VIKWQQIVYTSKKNKINNALTCPMARREVTSTEDMWQEKVADGFQVE